MVVLYPCAAAWDVTLLAPVASSVAVYAELLRPCPDSEITDRRCQVEVRAESLLPIELKTGKSPKEGVWPGHRVQLSAYVMLLEDNFNMNISLFTQ